MKTYCIHCKHDGELVDVRKHVAKNDQPYISGYCGHCDMKITRFVSKHKDSQHERPRRHHHRSDSPEEY